MARRRGKKGGRKGRKTVINSTMVAPFGGRGKKRSGKSRR